MAHRTFAIGDIHGDLDHLRLLLGKLPLIDAEDTVVFLGDYVDRGPRSMEVVRIVRALDLEVGCNVVCLRGNHEDAWLRVIEQGWPEFVMPPSNGCLATMRSYTGGPIAADEAPKAALLWTRSEAFFRDYRGKRVVVGHTKTDQLPPELSTYTVHDPEDLWAGVNVVAADTGCGKGGFLTAVELPSCTVYESRTL